MIRIKLALLLVLVLFCGLVFLTPEQAFSKKDDATPAQRATLLNHNPKVDNWNEAVVSFRIERLYNRVQGPHNE